MFNFRYSAVVVLLLALIGAKLGQRQPASFLGLELDLKQYATALNVIEKKETRTPGNQKQDIFKEQDKS